MAGKEYSDYQQDVIANYYKHRDTLMLEKLSELVSELYLAETDKKRERLWQRVHKAMQNLKVPPAIMDHIMAQQDIQILAKNLQEWQAGKMGRHPK